METSTIRSFSDMRQKLQQINILLLLTCFQREKETVWVYEFVPKSHAYPTKLRYKLYQNEVLLVGGSSSSLQAENPDELLEKISEVFFSEEVKIDIYEYMTYEEVYGNYGHYVGIWKYNHQTEAFEKQKEKGQGYYDPDEDK